MPSPRSKLVIVCTGCQAEPLSALGRIARNEHRNIKMEANDTLAFSSRMIPGSEHAVCYLMSACEKMGVRIHTTRTDPDLHVSGHAYQEDLRRLIRCIIYRSPKFGGKSQIARTVRLFLLGF